MVTRVVLAEDNYLVREGTATLLSQIEDVAVIGTCQDLESLFEMVAATDPHVVVTDIRMPPTNTDEGIQAANVLRESRPEIGVVVLSQFVSPRYAVALLEEGSSGRAYLLKENVSDVEQIASAIAEVAAGKSVIDPSVVDHLVAARSTRSSNPLERLTIREREVLEVMAQGKSNAAIAAALGLSERAAEKHISSIFSKLSLSHEPDTNRRVKAVLVYLSEG